MPISKQLKKSIDAHAKAVKEADQLQTQLTSLRDDHKAAEARRVEIQAHLDQGHANPLAAANELAEAERAVTALHHAQKSMTKAMERQEDKVNELLVKTLVVSGEEVNETYRQQVSEFTELVSEWFTRLGQSRVDLNDARRQLETIFRDGDLTPEGDAMMRKLATNHKAIDRVMQTSLGDLHGSLHLLTGGLDGKPLESLVWNTAKAPDFIPDSPPSTQPRRRGASINWRAPE